MDNEDFNALMNEQVRAIESVVGKKDFVKMITPLKRVPNNWDIESRIPRESKMVVMSQGNEFGPIFLKDQ